MTFTKPLCRLDAAEASNRGGNLFPQVNSHSEQLVLQTPVMLQGGGPFIIPSAFLLSVSASNAFGNTRVTRQVSSECSQI